ncbi:MAG TPA: transglutaminase-like cysteine peptidase, partial [Woeseiaceae bacterium]|nr:transglutaminase-like cysteine peptidase [Woeseiaceae bacterium]
ASVHAQPQWLGLKREITSANALPRQWLALLGPAARKQPLEQLVAVNDYFNQFRYASDQELYGVRDHWASPAEFTARGAGDCEDYALAKYAALRALGWPSAALRVVVLRDREDHVDHAVLAAKVGTIWRLLDNRAQRLLTWSEVPQYQPIYAVEDRGLTVFVQAPDGPQETEILEAAAQPDRRKGAGKG